MLNYTDLCWFIADILEKNIDTEIKAEQIKNTLLDYLWPIFDFQYIFPNKLTEKGKITITYNTLIFSEMIRKKYIAYGILITDKTIDIDCLNTYIVEGIGDLKETINKLKEILC